MSFASAVLEVGSWVAVVYDDDWWPGEIERMQDDAFTINFMKPQSGVNRFAWPRKTERDTLPIAEILCVLDEPPAPASRRHFSFSEKTFKRAEATMAKVMK